MLALGEVDRRVEELVRRVEVAAQQADPAQHGQGVRLPARLAATRERRDRRLEQGLARG